MKRLSLAVATGIVLFMAAGLVTAENQKESSAENTLFRAVFKVENLTCGACFSKINAGLAPLEGFSGMGASMLRSMVAVDFIPPLSPDSIASTITGLGYPAVVDSVDAIDENQSFVYMNSLRKGRGIGSGGCCGGGAGSNAPADCSGSGQTGCPPSAAPLSPSGTKTL